MIIRQLTLRHGRVALSRPAVRSWRRALATAVENRPSTVQDNIPLGVAAGVAPQTDAAQVPSAEHRQAYFVQDHEEFEMQKQWAKRLGAQVEPHYKPHELVNNPPRPSDVTLELLMASQAHLGHATGLWHPANARYIYGIREGVHIISLDVTASHLRRACKIVEATTKRGGLVLFVGTREGQDRAVVKAAALSNGCHLFDRWTPGTITNRNQILAGCTVQVVDEFDRQVSHYDDQMSELGAIKPDLVVCLNPKENYVMLRECTQHNIPTIGIVDTDCNPTWVTYPIPANDDSRRCTDVICGVLGRAGEQGILDRPIDLPTLEPAVKHIHSSGLNPYRRRQVHGEELDKIEKERKLEEQKLMQAADGDDIEEGQESADQVDDEDTSLSEQDGTESAAMDGADIVDASNAVAQADDVDEELANEEDEDEDEDEEPADDGKYDPSTTFAVRARDGTFHNVPREDFRFYEDQLEGVYTHTHETEASIDLAVLVAQKRRAMGETMSAADHAAIKLADEEMRPTLEHFEAAKQEMLRQIFAQTAGGYRGKSRNLDAEAEEYEAGRRASEAGNVDEAEVQGKRKMKESHRSRTAHYDGPVVYGPVQKHRRKNPRGRA